MAVELIKDHCQDGAMLPAMTSPRRLLRRRHAVATLVIAGFGLWVSERVSSDQARYQTALAPLLTTAIVVGGTILAVLVYLSIPSKWGERNAEFWGGGGLTRFAVEASFSVVAALVWSFALALLFGPAR